MWERFGKFTSQKRLDWTTAYYTVSQRSDEIVEPEQMAGLSLGSPVP